MQIYYYLEAYSMLDTQNTIILYRTYNLTTRQFCLEYEGETIESKNYRVAALKLAIRVNSDNYDYLFNKTKKISVQNKHWPSYPVFISYSKEEIAEILFEGGI